MGDPDASQSSRKPLSWDEPEPHWTDHRPAADTPEGQHKARFLNRFKDDLEALAAFQTKIMHINAITSDMYDEIWSLLMLKALREFRENSDQAARRIIIEMISQNIITPQAAAKASGYSRTSVYNWLKVAQQQGTADQFGPEPPDDMTDPAQIDH